MSLHDQQRCSFEDDMRLFWKGVAGFLTCDMPQTESQTSSRGWDTGQWQASPFSCVCRKAMRAWAAKGQVPSAFQCTMYAVHRRLDQAPRPAPVVSRYLFTYLGTYQVVVIACLRTHMYLVGRYLL